MTLPPGWTRARFTEIADVLDSRRVPLNAEERAKRVGPFPYYGANGVVGHIDDFIFEGDHALLAEDGGHFDEPERGVAYLASGKFWVNNHAHILRATGGVDCNFLVAWLNATNWMPYVGGTTRAKLTQAGLGQPEVGVPPLAEQGRIVAKLDALTARTARARADLDRIPALTAHYRQAVLSANFPEVAGEMQPFSDVVTEGLIGLVRSRTAQLTEGGTPYIRMQHFDLFGTWNSNELTGVRATPIETARFGLREGDVLFNTRNSTELVGKVGLCSAEMTGHLYNNNLLRLRFSNHVLPEFAYRQMQAPAFRMHLEEQKSATTSVAAIYQGSLYKTPFWVPPLSVQSAVVGRVNRALAEIDRLAGEAAAARRLLERLDRAVLAKAFRGELVAQAPADEPASVLLDRIRAGRAAALDRPRRGRKPQTV